MNILILFVLMNSVALNNAEGCGNPAIAPVFSFIVGGEDAVSGSWPWQVRLLLNAGQYICGGTLISNRFVLTAAHCVDGFQTNDVIVGLGHHTLHGTTPGSQDFGVSAMFIHGSYDRLTIRYDIAVLKLDEDVTFSDRISPACLPTEPIDGSCISPIITGWGLITQTPDALADNLQQAKVTYITNDQCNQPNWYDNFIADYMFCAGIEDDETNARGTCNQGDSGGPLLCQDAGRYFVQGITSFGPHPDYAPCGTYGAPSGFMRVYSFIGWINQQMSN